jgi:coenzyme F420-0:L-glutamate ligase / coenzyme F420-1:gamma-L-glutamate ligase
VPSDSAPDPSGPSDAAPPATLTAVGLPGIPEVEPGDDLAQLLLAAADRAGLGLLPGDVLVVSSKIVSKAEGRAVEAAFRHAAVEVETARVVAERVTPRGLTRIVQSRSGPVLAAAGVDTSNVRPGSVLLLPADPDGSAAELRRRLAGLVGLRPADIGVIVSDTAGRPWRDGQTDLAIGAAGIRVVDDLRGGTDPLGNPLEVTVRAVADELAALADLVKGKLDGVPAALVRGLPGLLTGDDQPGPGAATLLRTGAGDWFRLGHVEAARAAIGVPPGDPAAAPVRMPRDGVEDRLERAVDVALAGPDPITGRPSTGWRLLAMPDGSPGMLLLAGTRPTDPQAAAIGLGALAQRIAVAAWAEDLPVLLRIEASDAPSLQVRLVDRDTLDLE